MRYLSIMFLNILINITSMHTIIWSIYCIPYIDCPLGERILSYVQSTWALHQREVIPSSHFTLHTNSREEIL